MNIFQAIVLGAVQGLTEFLPVSSSGHLIIFSEFFTGAEQPLIFDTTMHLATALALILYFFNDLLVTAEGTLTDIFSKKTDLKNYSSSGKLGLAIIVGIIPAGLLGFFLEDIFEKVFRDVGWVVVFLLLGSAVMFVAEKLYKGNLDEINVKKGLYIGLFQSLALLPGFSRSGSTISGGMMAGLSREQAARFSFLLSIPIVLMAGIYQLVKSPGNLSEISLSVVIAGFMASFGAGLLTIKFLLKFVKTHTLYPFIIYRVLLAAVLIFILK